jgi:hypothetical protein
MDYLIDCHSVGTATGEAIAGIVARVRTDSGDMIHGLIIRKGVGFMKSRILRRLALLLAVAAVFSPGQFALGQFAAGLVDELTELYPDSHLTSPAKELSIETARGTIAGVHILIAGLTPSQPLQFQVTGDNGTPVRNASWYRMVDVFVSENTGLINRTEKYSGEKNPYVIRRAPFRIFEALEPVTSPLTPDSGTVALRLEIPVDSTTQPGQFAYTITIGTGGFSRVLQFSVGVHRAIVPPVNRSTLQYVNWFSLENICSDHHVEKWSESFWDMLATYARLMAKGRQNTFWFHWNDFFTFAPDGNVTEFRRDRLERYIRTFLGAGLHTIEGSPISGRLDWLSCLMLMNAPLPDGRRVTALSDTGKRMITQMAVRVIATMRENHWEQKWLQAIIDEPTDEYIDRYKEAATLLRSLKPDLQLLEATMTVNLSGIVNVWCPQVQEYQAHRDFFDSRRAAGDKVWVYTCLAPGGPWLNRLVDEERLRPVYIGWACAKFNLQGFLHWGLNHHGDQPYEKLVVYHDGPLAFLPAGDSHIIYPGKQGPLSSQRFEAHRIGMEDYELLSQLKTKSPEMTLKIIGQIFQAFDSYDKDISDYRKTRALLLETLDRL